MGGTCTLIGKENTQKVTNSFLLHLVPIVQEGKNRNDGVSVSESTRIHEHLNPYYVGGLFRCYVLDESICHFKDAGSILLLLFYF